MPRRRWRYYRTVAGSQPVRDFLRALDPDDGRAVRAAMARIAEGGLVRARHVRGDVYEARATHSGRSMRVLFSAEGRRRYILLALSGFDKKTRKTPPAEIELAEKRLRDWRQRGRQ